MRGHVGSLVLACSLTSANAWAKPAARVAVTRDPGAETCPDATALEDAVAERLGYRALRTDAGDKVTVRYQGNSARGFSASVALTDVTGRGLGARTLEDDGSTCDELGQAVALTVSVLLEGVALDREARRSDDPMSPPPPPQPPLAPTEEAVIRPRVFAGATLSIGAAPATAPGIRLGVGARARALSLDLEARGDLPVEEEFPDGRVRSSQRLLSLVPCVHLQFFAGCAAMSAGAQSAEGRGVFNARSGNAFMSTAGVRLGVEIPIGGGVYVAANGEGWLALTRTTVAVEPVEIWSTPPVGATFGVSIGYELATSARAATRE